MQASLVDAAIAGGRRHRRWTQPRSALCGERVDADVVIVGAGIAGLACARALTRAGRRVIVLDKARGVGGRCATRRILGDQPVDHGVGFLHGGEPAFLAALDELDAPRIEGWPRHVEGRGVPCQPDTYTARDRRLAFVSGVSVLPKHLARGLDVRTGALVTKVEAGRVALEDGTSLEAPSIVLTPPVEQLAALLPELPELAAARTLLGWIATVPCLTVIAAYPLDAPAPRFDVLYPDEGPLQVVLHDSSKRVDPANRVLVLQAGARASEAWLAKEPSEWQALLLAEAGRLLGAWAETPSWSAAHRWRYARFQAGSGLGGPLRIALPGGRAIGMAGEAFGPFSGVQGAFLSGERLAQRMLDSTSSEA